MAKYERRQDPPPPPPRVVGPAIEDQIKGVQRAHDVLAHQYAILVQRGTLTSEDAATHLRTIEYGIKSLSFLSDNREIIYEIAHRARHVKGLLHTVMDHPAVIAVLEAFPEARIIDIRPMKPETPAPPVEGKNDENTNPTDPESGGSRSPAAD
jgi:hypothetical protein